MTAVALKPQPQGSVSEAARQLGRMGGRPKGSFSPRGIWLRGVILEMRRSGHGCADTFRRLCLFEDAGPKPRSFRVSADTADDVWEEIGGDIRGESVTWCSFEKLWQRVS